MRRLAGSLLYFIAALLFVYSSAWILLTHKANAQNLNPSSGDVLGQKTYITPTPTISLKRGFFMVRYTITPVPSHALTPTPTKIPTPTATPVPTSKPTPIPTIMPKPTAVLTPTPAPQSNAGGSGSILDQINAYRASKGLSRATSDSQTCAFASVRAGEIAGSFNHDGFTNRISSHTLPYPSFSNVTENIAETSNAGDVVNMWINSPPHAENMQKDTPFICVAQNGNYFAYEGWKP